MSKTISIRVSGDVAEKLEAYRQHLNKQNPAGLELTVSDAARVLLVAGLEATERTSKRK